MKSSQINIFVLTKALKKTIYTHNHIAKGAISIEKITRIYKALSDETRLRILNLLHEGELCVCHITDILNMGQSKISRHLAYLKNSGLVADRRNGLWIHYSLKKNDSYLPLLKCLKDLRGEVEELRFDIKRLARKKNLNC